MSLRSLLDVNTTKEVKKHVNGTTIAITAKGITVYIPLMEWNRNGLDTIISK